MYKDIVLKSVSWTVTGIKSPNDSAFTKAVLFLRLSSFLFSYAFYYTWKVYHIEFIVICGILRPWLHSKPPTILSVHTDVINVAGSM